MDPWLEHPDLWPDVHNSLIAAIRDAMSPLVAPKYYIGLEQRVYLVRPTDLTLLGVPDLTVATARPPGGNGARAEPRPAAGVGVREVDLPRRVPVRETYLQVREAGGGRLVTLLEVLSPANKMTTRGRRRYLKKRGRVLESSTHLVEIDLLRGGEPMPFCEGGPEGGYRVFLSRDDDPRKGTVYDFGVRDPIPEIPLPLDPGDPEPPIDLGPILHALYDRARFDLRIRYDRKPSPPLDPDDADWAGAILRPRP